ncbi:MAG TPA: DNA-processing protein DprA [Vicinamibacterales bacterium]|nr:DNA-processing protein DprA [Vicinamibacterales bacterium]
MTLDQAVALSLREDLPRVGLTARLLESDPELLELAAPLVERAHTERERAAAEGVFVLPWNDPLMPPQLIAISDAPPALWYRGSLECLNHPAVAIVGSRAASAVALETARRLAADLASAGITVVSGLARGVDSAAHRGALDAGQTIAVLGSGVDLIYPREHIELADRIADRGLVISEYPPGTPPLPFHFPMRNRLISGLSRAVVVIEAADNSGSLITASCAAEQGRDVMAVPGNVLSGRNRGGHALIRDGAKIVECADDIVVELGLRPPAQIGAAGQGSNNRSMSSEDPVLSRMDPACTYDLDSLAAASGMTAPRLLPHLADLELRGLVRRAGGGRFMRQ